MMTDERLAKAAEEANRILVENLPDESECKHIFSPKFEKQMKKLLKRTEHPMRYQFLKTVATFLLILLLGASTVLTLHTEACEKFWGWIKEKYHTLMSYSYGDAIKAEEELVRFSLGFLPEGYKKQAEYDMEVTVDVAYVNDKNQILQFSYMSPSNDSSIYIDIKGSIKESGMVGINKADIYIYEDGTKGNTIVWVDEREDMMFFVSGCFTKEELIQIAENVVREK